MDPSDHSARQEKVLINAAGDISTDDDPLIDDDFTSCKAHLLTRNHGTLENDRFSTAFLATVIASLGSLNFGFTLGYTSPTELELEADAQINMSKSQFAWFASIIAIGAVLGSLIGGYSVERFGRKTTILFTSVFYVPGWCLISYAKDVDMLYAGRVCTGVGVGMSSLAVPVYIAEVSSARLRGGFGSINQLAVTCGILLAYVVGFSFTWRWTAMFAVGAVAVMVLTMVFMPETPRWLLANNRRHDAIKELEWLRGPLYDVEEECFAIESNLDQQESAALRDFATPGIYRPLIVGCMLMVFQQFCGINVILFYCAKIFKSAGFSNAEGVSLSVAGAQVVATVLACLLVDKSGRRVLLMVGGIAMSASNLLLGVYFDLADIPDAPGHQISIFGKFSHTVPLPDISWLAITCNIGFIVFFSLGWGPLPWLLMSEIFPPRVRGAASSVVTLVNWVLVFVVTNSFPYMLQVMHEQGTFWFFAVFSFLSFVYTYLCVPETKGKTLEEIEQIFTGRHTFTVSSDTS